MGPLSAVLLALGARVRIPHRGRRGSDVRQAHTSQQSVQGQKARNLCETVLFRPRFGDAVEVGYRQFASWFAALLKKRRLASILNASGGALAALADPLVEVLIFQASLKINLHRGSSLAAGGAPPSPREIEILSRFREFSMVCKAEKASHPDSPRRGAVDRGLRSSPQTTFASALLGSSTPGP